VRSKLFARFQLNVNRSDERLKRFKKFFHVGFPEVVSFSAFGFTAAMNDVVANDYSHINSTCGPYRASIRANPCNFVSEL